MFSLLEKWEITPGKPHSELYCRLPENVEYCKSSVKSLGAYLISELPEGVLNREGGGGFFTKSSDKDIFGSFSVLLSHILRNQHTILRLKYMNSRQFISNHTKINMQGCVTR